MVDKGLVGMIVGEMYSIKRQYPFVDNFNLMELFCLYIKYKNYVFDIETLEHHKDSLVAEMLHYLLKSVHPGSIDCIIKHFSFLSKIDSVEFERIYQDVVYKFISLIDKPFTGEFLTPNTLNRLISYFVNKEGCNTVYDPYCGSASILEYLNCNKFIGVDINGSVLFVAKILADIKKDKNVDIQFGNSILDWNTNKFDAVISCPPIEVRIVDDIQGNLSLLDNGYNKTTEEMFYHRSFTINNAKLVIGLEPLGFCYTGRHLAIRRYLVDNNLIDTIVYLPSNILHNTSIATALIICKQGRNANEVVRLIDATKLFIGENTKEREFAFDKLYSILESGDNSLFSETKVETIKKYEYSFVRSLYETPKNVKPNQTVVRLNDLVTIKKGLPLYGEIRPEIVKSDCFGNNVVDVVLKKNKAYPFDNTSNRGLLRCFNNDLAVKVILFSDVSYQGSSRYALYDKNGIIASGGNIKFMIPDETKVSAEYLIYLFTTTDAIVNSGVSLSLLGNMQLVIDSREEQERIVKTALLEYQLRKDKEAEAEAQRLGIKRVSSDLEHMLGTPFFKINNTLNYLMNIEPDCDDYKETVKALKDNFDYVQRIVKFNSSSINPDSFNCKSSDINALLMEYIESWENFGGEYFSISLNKEYDEVIEVNIDRHMFYVMADAIFGNAVRHGFLKRANVSENKMEIDIKQVSYNEQPFVLLSFCNNGLPMEDDFKIEDYISKGRFKSSTGRTGLGGYHVYEIVKGHKGYLNISSNKTWNVVVDILLPINNNFSDLPVYEEKCV